jgi:hypothetical protein
MHIMKKLSLLSLALFLIGIGILGSFYTKSLRADTVSNQVTGYAWAGDTIGYIFMNCLSQPYDDGSIEGGGGETGFNNKELRKKFAISNFFTKNAIADSAMCAYSNYGVTVNMTTFELNGFGWAPHVGWVQFGGLSGFPATGEATTNANAKFVLQSDGNYKLTGWAKILSGDQCPGTLPDGTPCVYDDLWDGWISFDGEVNSGTTEEGGLGEKSSGQPTRTFNLNPFSTPKKLFADGPTYQIIIDVHGEVDPDNNGSRYGWAGGQQGDVIGWVDFAQVNFPEMPTGPILTVTAIPNSVPYGIPPETVKLSWIGQNGMFTTCEPLDGVNLSDASKVSNWSGLSLPLFDASNQDNNFKLGVTVPGAVGTTVQYNIRCLDTLSGNWVTAIQSALVTITGPSSSLTVGPSCITEADVALGDNEVTLNWNSSGTSSCSITNYNGSVSAPGSGSGTEEVSQSTTFTLSCVGNGGSSPAPVSRFVSVAPLCTSEGTPTIPITKER